MASALTRTLLQGSMSHDYLDLQAAPPDSVSQSDLCDSFVPGHDKIPALRGQNNIFDPDSNHGVTHSESLFNSLS